MLLPDGSRLSTTPVSDRLGEGQLDERLVGDVQRARPRPNDIQQTGRKPDRNDLTGGRRGELEAEVLQFQSPLAVNQGGRFGCVVIGNFMPVLHKYPVPF